MNDIKNVCVYSASSTKIAKEYFDAAEKKGMVSRIDTSARVIQIVNTKICIDDLYDIDKENEMM